MRSFKGGDEVARFPTIRFHSSYIGFGIPATHPNSHSVSCVLHGATLPSDTSVDDEAILIRRVLSEYAHTPCLYRISGPEHTLRETEKAVNTDVYALNTRECYRISTLWVLIASKSM